MNLKHPEWRIYRGFNASAPQLPPTASQDSRHDRRPRQHPALPFARRDRMRQAATAGEREEGSCGETSRQAGWEGKSVESVEASSNAASAILLGEPAQLLANAPPRHSSWAEDI
ncbi:hypothetical protein TWF696_001395 [Orbilia brochopaga]|uniref:Uncharacterized protein n=1 Tax=Orbilia brochopaga TaxID=3140254 RepID=A0AAV9U9B7_9PEZI